MKFLSFPFLHLFHIEPIIIFPYCAVDGRKYRDSSFKKSWKTFISKLSLINRLDAIYSRNKTKLSDVSTVIWAYCSVRIFQISVSLWFQSKKDFQYFKKVLNIRLKSEVMHINNDTFIFSSNLRNFLMTEK